MTDGSGLSQESRQISVSFADADSGGDLVLTAFTHEEALGVPSVTFLDLASHRADIDPNDLLGHAAVVRLTSGEENRYFHGYVWSITCEGEQGGLWRYRAELRPWLGMLAANREYRVFTDASATDVVNRLLSPHSGEMEVDLNLYGSYRIRPLVVQYGESDLAFVNRLLEDEGVYYTFEHTESSERVILCDDSTQHDPRPGRFEMPYQPVQVIAPGMHDEDAITRWQRVASFRNGRYASVDFSAERPSTYVLGLCDGQMNHGPSGRDRYGRVESFGGPQTIDEAETAARLRMEESECWADVYRGETKCREMRPGIKFGIAEHDGVAAGTEFLVTRVLLSASSSAFVSSGGDLGGYSTEYTCSFDAIDASKPFRPQRTTPKPTASMQTAIVVSSSQSEDAPDLAQDEYCSVKLKFHWDHFAEGRHDIGDAASVSDGGTSCWIRTSQAWAGNRFGMVSVPFPGQEVMVDFIDGDPDRPIVVGRLYNEDNRPMMTPASQRLKMQLRDSGQNHVVLGSNAGDEGIELFSPTANTTIRIGRNFLT